MGTTQAPVAVSDNTLMAVTDAVVYDGVVLKKGKLDDGRDWQYHAFKVMQDRRLLTVRIDLEACGLTAQDVLGLVDKRCRLMLAVDTRYKKAEVVGLQGL